MKLLEEWKNERYYLKVGELFVKDVGSETINLTPFQNCASEFDHRRNAFKESYLYAKLHAEKHNLGKVSVIKIVRTTTEMEMDADKLTLDILDSYVKENENKGNFRGL